jgi:hypothetical protein
MEVYEFSVPIALVDFIPVFLFGISAVLMQRDLYSKMPKYAFACLAAGSIDTFLAGFLKAVWKLLYALGVCNFHVLNTMFLPTQSLGLLLIGLGIILMLTQRRQAALAVAPPLYTGTFVFIAMMVLGLGVMCWGLGAIAVKMKRKVLVPVFVLCFFCYMIMGYLASRDGSSAAMNWAEQSVNCIGQALLLGGVYDLHSAGLREFQLL